MSIKAGDLRTQVTLMRPDGRESGRNTAQQRGVTYTEAATVAAAKSDVSGREFFEAHAAHAEDVVTFTIRWREDVDATWRLRHHRTTYDILEVNGLGYMLDYMRIKCRAVTGGGR